MQNQNLRKTTVAESSASVTIQPQLNNGCFSTKIQPRSLETWAECYTKKVL